MDWKIRSIDLAKSVELLIIENIEPAIKKVRRKTKLSDTILEE